MRVVYWTTACLEPAYEAVSKEVQLLSRRFRSSWVFSVNPHLRLRWSPRERVVGAHPSLYPILRLVVPAVERRFDVNHVYGDMTPWLYHKSLHSRPTIHTITQDGAEPQLDFLDRAAMVITQTPTTRDRLLRLGFDESRLRVWYPGVDLDRFRPRAPSAVSSRPRLLFATAPRTREEMSSRGVDLLLETARLDPKQSLRLLYRPWKRGYTSYDETVRRIGELDLQNVHLTNQTVHDMAQVYRAHDFTVIPFTTSDGGKECPNSALESLAAGVPVLCSRACPFAAFIEKEGAGVVFDPHPQGLLAAVDAGLRVWPNLSRAARRAASRHLSRDRLLESYARLYDEVTQRTHVATPAH